MEQVVKKKRSSEQIVDYVLQQLAEKKLQPGDKLPTEKDLSELFGVSRIPLREAMSALSTLGIIDVRQGSGTYIKTYEPQLLTKVMYMFSLLDSISMEELFEVRAFIEAEASRLAAERATDDDILALRAALSRGDWTLKKDFDGSSIFDAFNEFHQHIIRCAHNKFLQQISASFRLLARHYHLMGFENNPEIVTQITKSHEEHHLLFRLIAAEDGEQAYELAKSHMEYEYHCILNAITASDAPEQST